jgi:dipeptide transport system substrate-binding protein
MTGYSKLLMTAAICVAGVAAEAKTLVYCSEGSPEGFDPAPYTAGTTFDASSRPIFNRLVEFEKGTTNLIPGLAESWEVSEDGLQYTFRLRPGVKFHTTEWFTPTRDLNADDVIFSFERQRDAANPWNQYTAGISYEYFNSMDMGSLIQSIEKVDDLTVRFNLTRPEAPFVANLAMDFASIMSKEYADQLEADGRMADLNQQPVGTGRSSWWLTSRTRSSAMPQMPSTGTASRRSTTSYSPLPPTRPCVCRSCRRANATSCPIRRRPTSRRSAPTKT